jgi:hypothetical protein
MIRRFAIAAQFFEDGTPTLPAKQMLSKQFTDPRVFSTLKDDRIAGVGVSGAGPVKLSVWGQWIESTQVRAC